MRSYLKAEDAADWLEVINTAKTQEKFEDLVRFLRMARTLVKDQMIDSELVYVSTECSAWINLDYGGITRVSWSRLRPTAAVLHICCLKTSRAILLV